MRVEARIPTDADWRRTPARFLFQRQQRAPRPADEIVTAFRDGRVMPRSLRRTEGFTHAVQEIGYQGIRLGDLVIHSMDGFAGAIGVAEADGKASPVVHAYRPQRNADPRYYAYLLRVLARQGFVGALAKGIRERSTAFDAETFRGLVLPEPSPTEQRAIADHLDAETARIDALIARKSRLAEMIQARFHSWVEEQLLQRAVGQSPLMYLTELSRPIVYGIVQAGPHIPGGVPYLKSGDVTNFDLSRLSCTSLEIDEQYHRARVRPGDLVMAMRASIGRLMTVPEDLSRANLTQGTARIAAAPDVDARWLAYVLRTDFVQEQCAVRAVGTTFKTLNIWDLRRIVVPLASRSQQAALAEEIKEREVRKDQLFASLQLQVQLLREHRQALITEAVTGELEIPGVA